jgi:hypothetical protein
MIQRLSSRQQWFKTNVIYKRDNGVSSPVGKSFKLFYKEYYFSFPAHLNAALKEYEELLKESVERNHFTLKREICPFLKKQVLFIAYEKPEQEEFVKVTKRTKRKVYVKNK